MIYTVTFNPSLDYIIRVGSFEEGAVNRTQYEKILPGGKGINVSIVLANLGHENTALGFTAGFTGDEIERLLKERGLHTDFIRVQSGFSRINVKMKAGQETEINGMGPVISPAELEALFVRLDALTAEDILVISGSIPESLPDDMYERILRRLSGRGIRVIVDAAGGLLKKVLPYHPWLIKPNNIELGELYHAVLPDRQSVIPYARRLLDEGARNVLVSMAGEGAVFVSEDGTVLESPAPEGEVVNSVGAGDSMVAGFLAGCLSSGSFEEGFYLGIACGSASAFSEELAGREDALRILQELKSPVPR